MRDAVIDASVILAIAKNERIDDSAASIVAGGVMSTANVSEVYAKLVDLKIDPRSADSLLNTLDRIEPLSLSQARLAGALRATTRHAGLSLGDRCCLALALELNAEVYTTEHIWDRIDVGCKVHILREKQPQ
ncbi:MAG: type II toxin-antitoxin system VapC family toxin [Acidobacteriota bacterium]